jgi:hypothetical protein
MATYRLFFIDWRTGRIGRVADIEAEDDDEAMRLAGARSDSERIELWCGGRKICRFEARIVSAPRPLV